MIEKIKKDEYSAEFIRYADKSEWIQGIVIHDESTKEELINAIHKLSEANDYLIKEISKLN